MLLYPPLRVKSIINVTINRKSKLVQGTRKAKNVLKNYIIRFRLAGHPEIPRMMRRN
jgi:hypothetical protein